MTIESRCTWIVNRIFDLQHSEGSLKAVGVQCWDFKILRDHSVLLLCSDGAGGTVYYEHHAPVEYPTIELSFIFDRGLFKTQIIAQTCSISAKTWDGLISKALHIFTTVRLLGEVLRFSSSLIVELLNPVRSDKPSTERPTLTRSAANLWQSCFIMNSASLSRIHP